VREYALETLADQDAVLVLDETGFLKQGNASCCVARQPLRHDATTERASL
jgi:SRSO17 transposase